MQEPPRLRRLQYAGDGGWGLPRKTDLETGGLLHPHCQVLEALEMLLRVPELFEILLSALIPVYKLNIQSPMGRELFGLSL